MEWKELTKESLEELKRPRAIFWCYVKDVAPIVHKMYKVCLITYVKDHPQLGDYWFCIYVKQNRETDNISDNDMLDFFSHYCIVESPSI